MHLTSRRVAGIIVASAAGLAIMGLSSTASAEPVQDTTGAAQQATSQAPLNEVPSTQPVEDPAAQQNAVEDPAIQSTDCPAGQVDPNQAQDQSQAPVQGEQPAAQQPAADQVADSQGTQPSAVGYDAPTDHQQGNLPAADQQNTVDPAAQQVEDPAAQQNAVEDPAAAQQQCATAPAPQQPTQGEQPAQQQPVQGEQPAGEQPAQQQPVQGDQPAGQQAADATGVQPASASYTDEEPTGVVRSASTQDDQAEAPTQVQLDADQIDAFQALADQIDQQGRQTSFTDEPVDAQGQQSTVAEEPVDQQADPQDDAALQDDQQTVRLNADQADALQQVADQLGDQPANADKDATNPYVPVEPNGNE